MPTRITFANGKTIDVADDPERVHEQLLTGHSTAVALENTEGERVYVNPAAIAYFEATHPYEAPIVEVIG
jgi:hypothetical protein